MERQASGRAILENKKWANTRNGSYFQSSRLSNKPPSQAFVGKTVNHKNENLFSAQKE